MSAPAVPGAGVLRALVARATLAPSMRNAQPWRWTVHADRVDLEFDADVAHRLEINDPAGRELVMSCGAALLTLRVAAAEALFDARVQPLPDPRRPGLLATVTMETGVIDAAFADLDAVIPLRHTSWTPFDDRPLPDGLAPRLVAEARFEGALLHVVPDADRPDLAGLLRHADHETYTDPRRRTEVARWIGARWADGGRVPPALAVVPARAAEHHPELGDRIADHEAHLLDGAPCVAVLATRGDATADWLAAGQALQRVLLVAAASQVHAGFLNAPCQVDADRERLRALLPGGPCPQLVLRLGHPMSRSPGTPRRPVDDVVTLRAEPPDRGDLTSPGTVRGAGADFTEDSLG